MAASIVPTAGSAQQVTEQRITSSLGKLTGAAPIVDVELLRQEAAGGAGKQMSGLPNWSKVAKLPQMVVEIDFVNDSVAIEPKSYRTLGLIADALHHPNLWAYKFLIVGHASATGGEKHNFDLSEKRADAIKEALATTFAVQPERLYSVGVGEYFPIDAAKAESADNRRVQLFNLGLFTQKP
ncbi:OmpA family protein (plasmid) [Rhizobium tumorigenes]|uniref:OmpA family protein n=2 Tax=Rhizobium tumorigenes TaxID=2041385 RepID=A0AAF1KWV8_9HYPH|nr:OmpA family protein [Rhizobium tumorigenes]WFR98139.1 OmpA family protein [Rhizobium tumorigenes]WFS03662.1 OmpA family protein [Rhizobium tumorigenes]